MDDKMPQDTLKYLSDKTEHDLLVILEGFKMLLSDADKFDELAEKLDYSDDCLVELREDVHNFLEDVETVND
jgi:hypothetical protein